MDFKDGLRLCDRLAGFAVGLVDGDRPFLRGVRDGDALGHDLDRLPGVCEGYRVLLAVLHIAVRGCPLRHEIVAQVKLLGSADAVFGGDGIGQLPGFQADCAVRRLDVLRRPDVKGCRGRYRFAGFPVVLLDGDLSHLALVVGADGNGLVIRADIEVVLGSIQHIAVRGLFFQQVIPVPIGEQAALGVAVRVGFEFANSGARAVVDAEHGPGQRAAGRGIGLIDFYIALFERVAERHRGRPAVWDGDRLAGGGVVPPRRIHLCYRVSAGR